MLTQASGKVEFTNFGKAVRVVVGLSRNVSGVYGNFSFLRFLMKRTHFVFSCSLAGIYSDVTFLESGRVDSLS